MITLLTILIVVAAIVLVLVVLVQNSKGGGLSSNFSSSNAIMGVKKTTDFIEKATWGLACFIIVGSIACVSLRPKTRSIGPNSEVTGQPIQSNEAPDMSTTAPVQQQPAQPTPTAPAK